MKDKYKLLILDLDGTLTNSEKKVSKRTKEALFEAMDSGVKVVLASGRPTFGIRPVADALELEERGGYILAYNGGRIIDAKSKQVLYKQVIDTDAFEEILALTDKYKLDFACTENEDILITNNANNRYMNIEAGINKMKIKEIPDVKAYMNFEVPKFVMFYDEENIKTKPSKDFFIKDYPVPLSYAGVRDSDIEYLKDKEAVLSNILGDRFEVYRSEPFFLEVLPKGIDKAKSIERLLEILGLKVSEVIACGDGFNDVSMINFAGLGVAMENAVKEAKDVADYITLSNDEDGIAHVIDKFIFSR